MNVNYNSLSNGRDTNLKRTWQTRIAMVLFLALFSFIGANAQVGLTATGGSPTGSFTTLKGAFDAINLGTHTGTITISITGDTSETASAILNASGSGSASYATIAISPSGGASRTISGSVAGLPLVDLNGADNVTINGLNTGGNTLTISNTSTSSTSGTSTIRFQTDATSNTITNCNVLGSATMAIATNGGNIWFGSAAISTGNDNNTVSNCNIGPAGSNLPSKCVYFSGTSNTNPGTSNSGNIITGNNIFDYFSATVSSAGIDLNSGSATATITNNKFYQTASRTQTATGLSHRAISLNNSSGDNYTVTGNTIGYNSNAGTGTYTFVFPSTTAGSFIPIFVSTGSTNASAINSNTITNIAISGAASGTTSSSPFRGIYISSGLATCNSNTIGSQSATGAITYTSSSTSASDVVGIYNFGSANWTTNNNTVGGFTVSNSSTGATNLYGLRANTSSSVAWTATGNTVGGTVANSMNNTSTATGTLVRGIENLSPAATFTGNTVRNMSVAGGTGTGSTASMVGIAVSATSSNHTVGSNTIYNLSSSLAGAAVVNGINFSSSTGTNIIEKNFVYDLNAANTAASINGIYIIGGTATYRNNMIRLGIAGNSATVGLSIAGINESTAGIDNIYHNSIYIGGAPTSGSSLTYGLLSTITTNTRNFINNIFVNARSNSGSTGKHYAIRAGGTAANPAGLTSNYNIFYAGGTGGFTGFFNSADQLTIANWRTATGQDANSYTENVPFLGATATTPDLHLNSATATFAEGLGVSIASVTDDFDGQTRSGLTPVDIGADALAGTGPSVVVINSVSASPSATSLCTAASRVITANITAGGSPITSVTLNYAFNGTAQTPITMTGGTTTGTSNWTATIPVASPVNAVVTWSVTAVDPVLTKNTVGTSYQDAPLFGTTATATATPSTVCNGSSTVLNAYLLKDGSPAASIGSGTSLTTDTTQPTAFNNRWPSYRMQLLFTASELSASGLVAGNISAMAFNIATLGSAATNAAFTVQIGNTALSALTSTFVSTASGFTTTFPAATYTHTASGIQTIPFSTPFAWDGTSNIIVDVAMNGANSSNNSQTYYTVVGANRMLNTETSGTGTPTLSGNRLNVIFTGKAASLGTTVSWSDGTNTFSGNGISVTPTGTTNYTATISLNGCSATASTGPVTIQSLPSAPTATNGSRCGTGVVTNATVASTTGLPTPTFRWYAASTGGTALQSSTSTSYTTSISATTTLYVTELNGTCESSPRTAITLTVNPAPTITITPTTGNQVNCGTGSFNVVLHASSADSGMTYSWTTTSGTAVINSGASTADLNVNVTESADFTVTGTPTDPTCNPVVLLYPVSVYPLPNATVTTTATGVCPGTSATINSGLSAGNFTATCITPQATLSTPPAGAVTLINAGTIAVTQSNATPSVDDGYWNAIPLGFSFNYFGNTYTTLNISTNGVVNFGATGTNQFAFAGPPAGFPSTANPANTIAVCARDMYLLSGSIKYWTEGNAPNRKFIVQYANCPGYVTTGSATGNNSVEAVFYETLGNVDIRVISSLNGTGGTTNAITKYIGLQNDLRTIGATAPNCSTNVQNYWNGVTAEITAPQAWRFSPPANYTITWSTVGAGNVLTTVQTGTNVFSLTVSPTVTTTYDLRYTNQTTGCTNLVDSDRVTMTIISNVAPSTTAVATPAAICNGQSTTLTLTGNVNSIGNTDGLTYQWQVSTDAGATWTNIASATSSSVTVTPTGVSQYRALVAACTGTAVASSAASVTYSNVIDSTTPGSRCGTGTVTLSATSPTSGASIKWYAAASGGTALSTGASFTTPSITATTTYYVAAETTGPACSSPRTPVVATITTPPTFSIGAASTIICNGSTSAAFTDAAAGANYDTFTISPNTGIASSNLSGVFSASFNPTATTVYTITASQSTGSLCSTSITFTVNVNSANVTAATSASAICLGSSVNLTASSFTGGNVNATIGTATTLTSATTQPTAFCNRWPSYRMQTVYTAAELQAAGLSAGNITSMAFNITTLGDGATNPGMEVKIGTTSLSALTTFESTTGYTTVYPSQTYTHTASGLQTIPFSTPFVWNGTSNIIVDMIQSGANSINNSQTYYTATAGNTVAYTTTASTNAASLSTNRLNVVFAGSNSVNATNTYTYSWTSDPVGFTASTSATTATPAQTTSYYVTATSPNGCTATGSVSVTVNTDPIANITGGANSICLGSPTIPSVIDFDSTVGALWSSSNTAVATVNGNGVVTPLSAGTTIITARIENPTTGCTTYAANPQTVVVYSPLAITSQPSSLSVLDYDGTNTTTNTFSVTASGSVTGYQWQVSPTGVEGSFSDLANGGFYSGVTTSTLTITNATTAISGLYYRAVVSGNSPCASPVSSDAALLTVSDVSITADPVFGAPICTSGDRTITVGVSGPTGTSVVWQYSDDNGSTWTTIEDTTPIGALTITGDVTSTSLELHNITSVNNGWLIRAAAVSGETVVFSNPTTIVVNQSAVVNTGSPVQNATVCNATAGTATFTVSATGATGYQWQYSNDGSTWASVANGTPTGATYSNATTASLTVNVSSALVAGPHYYRAMVNSTNPCPAQYSNVAQLLINTPTVNITASNAFICNPGGTAVTLTASGTAATYSWSPSTGLSATTGASVTANPTVTTTYTVTGTETGGCTNTAQFTVSVGKNVTAAATATPGTICPGATVQLNATDNTSYPQSIGTYTFATSTETFESIKGQSGSTAITLSSVDDAISSAITIPFTFNYGGVPFTTFKMNSNGWINLGATATSTTSYSVLTTENNVIAAFNRDLKGINTTSDTFYVQTTGTSPNQITKVEWNNIKGYDGVSPFNPRTGTFQIWLYEGSNKVEMHYGDFTTDSSVTTTTTVQVGLRGATSGVADVRSLSNTGNWSSPTVGTANASTVALGNFATPFLPSNGLVYSFTPTATTTYTYAWTSTPAGFTSSIANPTVTPSENTTYSVVITNATGCSGTATTSVTIQSGASITTQPVNATACQGTTATFSVVANGPGLTYQWFNSTGAITGATSATLSLASVTVANSGSTYYVVVTPTCGSPITSDTVTLTVNPTPTATAPATQTFCAGTTTPIVLSGTPSGVTFDISGGAAIGLANQAGVTQIPSFTATAGTATITVTPKANGCTGTAVTFTINVNVSPATPTLGSNSPVCAGSTLNLTASTVSVSGYSMNSNSGVSFIDISTTGTSVGTVADDSEHNITIPSFVFNGTAYTTARVGMNGVVVLGSTTGEITHLNVALPSTAHTAGNIFLAPFWDDLDIQTAASIKTQTVGNVHIIQYTTAAHDAFTTGSITFQIQLNTVTGAISYVYQDVIFGSVTYDAGASATVGLQLSSTSAIQYSLNTASLTNGQSITFTPNTASYAWTGPNSFTSNLQNPSIANVTSAAAGVYSVVVSNPATGCSSAAATTTVVITTPATYYADADGDTYGNLAVTALSCTGAPSGYVSNSTDCDDTNPAKYQSGLLYIDADGDGYTAGQATVCYGAAVPSGYSATSLGTDCNDNDATLTTNCTPASSIVNVKMFIQGYYFGSGTMASVMFNQSAGVLSNLDVEMMSVELHDATTFGLVASATAMLHTDGTLSAAFTTAPSGSYYVVVKGRNMVQTWSAAPQTVGSTPLLYDFTTAASQAYGDNMAEVEPGVFAMYSGEFNADDFVEYTDYTIWETDANNFAEGDYATDLNGDGFVEYTDYTIWETNAGNFVSAIYPF